MMARFVNDAKVRRSRRAGRPKHSAPVRLIGAVAAAALAAQFAWLAGLPQPARAQGAPVASTAPNDDRPTRREVWDIRLGAKIADLPDDFIDYACGTNGGPPSAPLSGWKDFRRCRPEASGLREVYFRYDDELEYWAKANNLAPQMEQYIGTKTYGFPITVSALIGEDGTVRGVRIVTDPRDASGDRDEAYLLRNFLNARFGRDGWQCEDLAAAAGETPVFGIFIKQNCAKTIDAQTRATLVTRYLRKPGQSQYDPHSGKETVNQFDSNVRFELIRTE